MGVMTDKQLNDRFDKLDKRLEKTEKIFDDQFLKLYYYINRRFDEVDKRFDNEIGGLNVKFDRLQSSVDGIAKGFDDERLERHALEPKVDRHDGWIKTLARKTQTRLS